MKRLIIIAALLVSTMPVFAGERMFWLTIDSAMPAQADQSLAYMTSPEKPEREILLTKPTTVPETHWVHCRNRNAPKHCGKYDQDCWARYWCMKGWEDEP